MLLLFDKAEPGQGRQVGLRDQNDMTAITFLPPLGMLREQIAHASDLNAVSRFGTEALLLGLDVVTGTLLVLAARAWPMQPTARRGAADAVAPKNASARPATKPGSCCPPAGRICKYGCGMCALNRAAACSDLQSKIGVP
ncbi:MAG: hypothetical protein ACFB13_03570 [Kiloniellaceae bacterium]